MVTAQPPRTAPAQLLTADDLLRMPADDLRSELIRGELCEMPPPGAEHSEIAGRVVSLLRSAVVETGLGRVFTDGGVLVDRDPDTVRAPDVSLFLANRLPLTERVTGYFSVLPNLVVEVQSRNDRQRVLHDKAIMWLNAGVELVWVILPERRSVEVYRTDRTVKTVTDDGLLDGMDVLPEFSCSLDAIFGPADQAASPTAR